MRATPFVTAVLLVIVAEPVLATDCNTIKDAKLKQLCIAQKAPPAKAVVTTPRAVVPPPAPSRQLVVPPPVAQPKAVPQKSAVPTPLPQAVKPQTAPKAAAAPPPLFKSAPGTKESASKSIVPPSMVPVMPGSASVPPQRTVAPQAAPKPIKVAPLQFNPAPATKESAPKGIVPPSMVPVMPGSASVPPQRAVAPRAEPKPIKVAPLQFNPVPATKESAPKGIVPPSMIPVMPGAQPTPRQAPAPAIVVAPPLFNPPPAASREAPVCKANQILNPLSQQCQDRDLDRRSAGTSPNPSIQPPGLPIGPAKLPATTLPERPKTVTPLPGIICASNQILVNSRCVARAEASASNGTQVVQPPGLPIGSAKVPTNQVLINATPSQARCASNERLVDNRCVPRPSAVTPLGKQSAQPLGLPVGPDKVQTVTGLTVTPARPATAIPLPTIFCTTNQIVTNNGCVARPVAVLVSSNQPVQPPGLPVGPNKVPATVLLANIAQSGALAPSPALSKCAANQILVDTRCLDIPTTVQVPISGKSTQQLVLPAVPMAKSPSQIPATVQTPQLPVPPPNNSTQTAGSTPAANLRDVFGSARGEADRYDLKLAQAEKNRKEASDAKAKGDEAGAMKLQLDALKRSAEAKEIMDNQIAREKTKSDGVDAQFYGNYCGKGWTGGKSGQSPPVNAIDSACQHHDFQYAVVDEKRKAAFALEAKAQDFVKSPTANSTPTMAPSIVPEAKKSLEEARRLRDEANRLEADADTNLVLAMKAIEKGGLKDATFYGNESRDMKFADCTARYFAQKWSAKPIEKGAFISNCLGEVASEASK